MRNLEYGDSSRLIHKQTFATLAISRPVLHLFPNLTHLTWAKDPARPGPSLVLALLFLNPTLQSLKVVTGKEPYEGDLAAIANFFRMSEIYTMSMNLTILSSQRMSFNVLLEFSIWTSAQLSHFTTSDRRWRIFCRICPN